MCFVQKCKYTLTILPSSFILTTELQLRSGYLKHVIAVFSRVGYTRTEMRNRLFDVMWAHDYPFGGELKDMLQTLEPHQKVRIPDPYTIH